MSNLFWSLKKVVVGFSLVMFCGGLAHADKTLTKEGMLAKRTKLSGDIAKLALPLKCSNDHDCAFLEMGTKPCGGPWKYILYSKKNAKIPALKKKIAEYGKLDQSYNKVSGMMSDCSMTLPPEPKCVAKVCEDSAQTGEGP